MFQDADWVDRRSLAQRVALNQWLGAVENPVIIECGAGTHIPSARRFGERIWADRGAAIIRINVRDAQIGSPGISIAMGALAALRKIDDIAAKGQD